MEYTGKKYKLEIERDEFAESPREWQDGSEMICFHSRYTLGDKHNYSDSRDLMEDLAGRYVTPICFDKFGVYRDNFGYFKFRELFQIVQNNLIILPIYLYDHSGITISTSPFSCRFDSGQVGWIYSDYLSENKLEREVELYDNYIQGEVYQYVLSEKKVTRYKKVEMDENWNEIGEPEFETIETWEQIDSCTGFYGDNFRESGIFDEFDKDVREDLGIIE